MGTFSLREERKERFRIQQLPYSEGLKILMPSVRMMCAAVIRPRVQQGRTAAKFIRICICTDFWELQQ